MRTRDYWMAAQRWAAAVGLRWLLTWAYRCLVVGYAGCGSGGWMSGCSMWWLCTRQRDLRVCGAFAEHAKGSHGMRRVNVRSSRVRGHAFGSRCAAAAPGSAGVPGDVGRLAQPAAGPQPSASARSLPKTAYAWGLRRNELRNLELCDLGTNPKAPEFGACGIIHVRFGKAMRGSPHKRRAVLTVPLFDWAVDVLTQWTHEASHLSPTRNGSDRLRPCYQWAWWPPSVYHTLVDSARYRAACQQFGFSRCQPSARSVR